MKQEDCINIGKITRLKGFKGDVHAFFEFDDVAFISELNCIYLLIGKRLVEYPFDRFMPKGNKGAFTFPRVTNEEQAKQLLEKEIFLPRDQVPEDDQINLKTLIGFTLVDELVGEVGEIVDYNDEGIQDLLFIEFNGEEVLCPLVDAFVKNIDFKKKILYTQLPEGLLNLNS